MRATSSDMRSLDYFQDKRGKEAVELVLKQAEALTNTWTN